MKVHILIENTSNSELIAEHGLSFFIEYNDKKILLDAGQTSAFMDNAKKMKVDIENANFCVLSHGHYDHSGGFAAYFKENADKRLYAMNTAIDDYYSGSGGDIHKIGIPKDVYPMYKENFVLIDRPTKVAEGIYLIPHSTKGLEEIGKRAKLYKKEKEEYIPDNFSHELSLVFDTDKGLVILNSCSHSGIINIMEEVKQYFGHDNIYAFFGGLHMKGKKDDVEICTFSETEIEEMACYLKNVGIKKIYTGHCTGIVGFELIMKYLAKEAEYISTGRTIIL